MLKNRGEQVKPTPWEVLEKVVIERPKHSGRYWRGVGHAELDRLISGCLERRGIGVSERKGWGYGVGLSGVTFCWKMELGDCPLVKVELDPELEWWVVVQNSNTKKGKLLLCLGVEDRVTGRSLIVHSERTCKITHKTRLEILFVRLVLRVIRAVTAQSRVIARMKRTWCPLEVVDGLLNQTMRRGLLSGRALGEAIKESDYSKIRALRDGSFWSLVLAYSYGVQRKAPRWQVGPLEGFWTLALDALESC